MVKENGTGMSIREFREASGIPLSVKDFIVPKGPCDNPLLYLPLPYIPSHLVKKDKVEELNDLLKTCTKIAGPWGNMMSETEGEKFKDAADKFKKITGVEVIDILKEARMALANQLEDETPFPVEF